MPHLSDFALKTQGRKRRGKGDKQREREKEKKERMSAPKQETASEPSGQNQSIHENITEAWQKVIRAWTPLVTEQAINSRRHFLSSTWPGI